MKNMKTKIIIIAVVIIVITAFFGWRYYYLPNVVMAGRSPVMQNAKISSQASKKETGKVKSAPAINMRTKPKVVEKENLLKNGRFKERLENWQLWQSAKTFSNTVNIINVTSKTFKNAVRIENPIKKLVGIQQRVKVKSNTVYRLSGIVRSTATNNNDIIFGGRIGFFLPPQKEKQIVWMSEYNQWWEKEVIFTNKINGMATVYIHMGYGGVASTGEFSDVRLEEMGR